MPGVIRARLSQNPKLFLYYGKRLTLDAVSPSSDQSRISRLSPICHHEIAGKIVQPARGGKAPGTIHVQTTFSGQDEHFRIIFPRFAPVFRVELRELLEVDASLRTCADERAFLLPL